jgi:hypothetical protein
MMNKIGFSTYHELIADELRAALRRYFDKWDQILDKPEAEQPLYKSTIEQYRISVIVLCSALVEYAINFYLSTKSDATKFKDLESKPLFVKWTEVPKQFVPTYDLPPKSELAEDLSKLIERRKAIVHAKPAMSIDDDNRHQGNHPPVALDENDFISRCASLPLRLVENLLQFDRKAYMELDILHNPCGMVAGVYSEWRGKCKVAAMFPRELIREIMQQGYSRKIAVECAIQFRSKPPVLEKAEYIIVRWMGKEIAKLKPLKFYNMV